jgi:carbonyl reductase 1
MRRTFAVGVLLAFWLLTTIGIQAAMSMFTTAAAARRVAVVTGANKGIGYHIALQLAQSGLFDNVVLACRDRSRAAAALESISAELAKDEACSAVTVSAEDLTVGDESSHERFAAKMKEAFGKVDCLVNNAGFAFKGADPTPFEGQTKPTIDINFRGTVAFTETMLPLIKEGTTDPRIVNVASMSGRLGQLSPELQKRFSSETLTMSELHQLVNDFEEAVHRGTYRQEGWGSSNYGLSKLALIAATRVLARENPDIAINSCCPGYCATDMSSHKGPRHPSDGAKNAVLPATMKDPPTGAFFSDYQVAEW